MKCPYCAEKIQDAAIKCRHCGEWFDHDVVMEGPDVDGPLFCPDPACIGIVGTDGICTSCGKKVDTPPLVLPLAASAPKPSSKSFWHTVNLPEPLRPVSLFLFVGGLLIMGGIFLFSGGNHKTITAQGGSSNDDYASKVAFERNIRNQYDQLVQLIKHENYTTAETQILPFRAFGRLDYEDVAVLNDQITEAMLHEKIAEILVPHVEGSNTSEAGVKDARAKTPAEKPKRYLANAKAFEIKRSQVTK